MKIATGTAAIGWASMATDTAPVLAEFAYGSVWTACVDGGSVLRFDPASGAMQARIVTGGLPFGICCAFGRVWFADQTPIGNGALRSIDPATNTVDAGAIATGSARGIVADASRIWVGNHYANTAVAVDPVTRSVIKSIPIGVQPFARHAFDGRVLWFPCFGSAEVCRIDTGAGDAVLPSVPVGAQPWSARLSADGSTIWCVSYQDRVYAIDRATGTVRASYPLPSGSGAHDCLELGNYLMVSMSSRNELAVLDLANGGALFGSMPTATDPAGLCALSDSFLSVCAMGNVIHRRMMVP